MTNYVYSRYDTTTGQYLPPFIAANDDNACRTFVYIYGVPQPVDVVTYKLMRIGMFNNETGCFDTLDPVEVEGLVTLIDRIKSISEVDSHVES